MSECIFCKIVKGELPSFKVWEDDDYIAFLDIFPSMNGMTLVIPKKHHDSYVFDMSDSELSGLMLAAKKVGKLLDAKLAVPRTAVVIEGMDVNHAHVRLYPLSSKLSVTPGPKADMDELKKIAEHIRK